MFSPDQVCMISISCFQGLSVQQQQSGDEDAFTYNNTLRRSIFEAYSGIFNGMSKEKVNMYMPQYIPVCLQASVACRSPEVHEIYMQSFLRLIP